MEETKNNIPQANVPEKIESLDNNSNVQKEIVGSVGETEKKEKSSKGLMSVIFLLLFVIIAMGAYILIREGYFSEEKETNKNEENKIVETQEEEKEIPTEIKPQLENFEGEYISAEIPQGWSVKEYKDDFKGSVPEGSQYILLTSLEVNHESKNIFKLEILDGVGSIGCPQIVLFKDSPENFEEKQNESNEIVGIEAQVLDYTNTPYSEITLFGTKIRRVGTKVFYDTDTNTVAFEPQCENNWIELEELLTISVVSYFNIVISPDATQEELTILDSILESMKIGM